MPIIRVSEKELAGIEAQRAAGARRARTIDATVRVAQRIQGWHCRQAERYRKRGDAAFRLSKAYSSRGWKGWAPATNLYLRGMAYRWKQQGEDSDALNQSLNLVCAL